MSSFKASGVLGVSVWPCVTPHVCIPAGPPGSPDSLPAIASIMTTHEIKMWVKTIMHIYVLNNTETEMLTFWWNFRSLVAPKCNFWQLNLYIMMKTLWKWKQLSCSNDDRIISSLECMTHYGQWNHIHKVLHHVSVHRIRQRLNK